MRPLLIATSALLVLWGCVPAATETSPKAKPATDAEVGAESGSGSDLRLNPNYGQ